MLSKLGSLGSVQDNPVKASNLTWHGRSSYGSPLSFVAITSINVFHLNRSLFRRLPGCAAMVAASWLATVEIEIAAPASGRELAPPNSDRPWAPPNLPQHENTLREGSGR